MMASSETESTTFIDNFKEDFKYYKRRKPPPDFENVIDFHNLSSEKSHEHQIVKSALDIPSSKHEEEDLDLIPVCEWQAFRMEDLPGFTYIVNPFRSGAQYKWIRRCLQDYPNYPNVCNLDALEARDPHVNLWDEYCKERLENPARLKQSGMYKLRWVTLGYHHDWNTKKYNYSKKGDFPEELRKFSAFIAARLGYKDYSPEAAIVNFYHLDSTLAGHTDHSEEDRESPLISISFGQSAVFLLGGSTKASKPKAMFIKSGDIVVMSKETRLNYHAVPKILSPPEDEPLPECLNKNEQQCSCVCDASKKRKLTTGNDIKDVSSESCHACLFSSVDWQPVQHYLKSSRINMNIRQVLR